MQEGEGKPHQASLRQLPQESLPHPPAPFPFPLLCWLSSAEFIRRLFLFFNQLVCRSVPALLSLVRSLPQRASCYPYMADRQYIMVEYVRRRRFTLTQSQTPSARRRLIGENGRVTPWASSFTFIPSSSSVRHQNLPVVHGSCLKVNHAASFRPRSSGLTRPVLMRHRSTASCRARATAAFLRIPLGAPFSKTHFQRCRRR